MLLFIVRLFKVVNLLPSHPDIHVYMNARNILYLHFTNVKRNPKKLSVFVANLTFERAFSKDFWFFS